MARPSTWPLRRPRPRRRIAAARKVLEPLGLKVQSEVVEAHAAWRGILDKGTAVGADLIVMGSHGRRGVEKMILGSVTQSVLAHAHLPVLVVRD